METFMNINFQFMRGRKIAPGINFLLIYFSFELEKVLHWPDQSKQFICAVDFNTNIIMFASNEQR